MKAMQSISRNIIGITLLCISCIHIYAQDEEIKKAESAYVAEIYDVAIEEYESLLKNYGASAELYYNLGNAYYKSGKTAHAILNYERAILIKPGDADIRFNLELARQQIVDKIEPLQEFFMKKWMRSAQNLIGVDAWATIGLTGFVLFILCLALYFFSKWMYLKKIGFYFGIVLFVTVIVANIFAWNQKKELENRNAAIVFAPTVTAKSSPDNSGTDLFVLHEGTKVFIRNTVGDWKEIRLEDGNIGWINKKDIVII